MATSKDRLTDTPEGLWLYQREATLRALTKTICELMEKQSTSRAELAQCTGIPEGVVAHILDVRSAEFQSLTVLIDIFTALDSRVVFTVEPL